MPLLDLVFAALLFGQVATPPATTPSAQAQPRDPGSEPKGTAVIRGKVVTADGRPLRRVQVSLRGTPLTSDRTVGTGLDGEYEITDLPAGRFTLRARRNGYLDAEFGQRRYGEPGRPLEVADGAALDRIDLTMERAGVISGRITDETGEPVARANVWVMQSLFYRGRRQVVPIGGGRISTDDTGLYRVPSLPPGDYVVVAYFRETWVSDGREKQMLSYAPSYFPGTASIAEAVRVKVAAGQETAAIDLSLVPGRAATLSGTVLSSEGAPLGNAMVAVEQEILGPAGGTFSSMGSARTNPDGTWRILHVPPGSYRLAASGTNGDRGPESASMPLHVTGADLANLVLQADAGGAIAGHVVTEGGVALPSGVITVYTQSSTYERNSIRTPPGPGDGRVAADGSFMWRSGTGPVLVRATLPTGWFLKRVLLGDRDIADIPQAIHAGQQLSPLRVVIAPKLASLSGNVSDAAGKPVDAIVVLFPADPARWHEAANSVRTTRPGPDGAFRLTNLRPGEYLAVAVEHLVQAQLYDPELLTALRDGAVPVVIRDEPVAIDLKVRR